MFGNKKDDLSIALLILSYQLVAHAHAEVYFIFVVVFLPLNRDGKCFKSSRGLLKVPQEPDW